MNQFRKDAAARRAAVENKPEKNAKILETVEKELASRSDRLFCFVSYGTEVDTIELMKRWLNAGKKLYCPKVEGKIMRFYEIREMDDLKPGYHDIPEPVGDTEECVPTAEDTIIVPGLVFDENRGRCGYGGGYYDKYLSTYPVRSIAVCYEEQIIEKLETMPWDVTMDEVVTDLKIRK